MNQSWMENEKLFRSELTEGDQWTRQVGKDLIEAGIAEGRIVIPEFHIRESVDDRFKFQNEKDIVVTMPEGQLPVVIECKSRRLEFGDDPASYPYSTAFVDTVTGWERKIPTPFAVVLTSRTTGSHLCIAPRTSKDRWKVTKKHDRVRNITETFYECPRAALLPFEALIERLSEF